MNAPERGRWDETLAIIHIEKNNTQVLLRNWRWNRYEIDLIGRTGKVWVFVGVRVCKWGFGASGVEAVNSQKQ